MKDQNGSIYHVLLIEDDRLDQMAFERFVEAEKLPYKYQIAGSVAEARNIIKSNDFDVIVADYYLGDGTIFDVFDLMKPYPTIITTGTGDESVAVKAMKEGAYDYLIKDIDRNYLQMLPVVVENAIVQKKTHDKMMMLSHALMSISDSVYVTDMNHRIVFVNNTFCHIYGYEKEDIIGKKYNILEVTEKEHQQSQFKISSNQEFYNRKKDGTIFPVSLTRSIIQDENDHKIAVVSIARDITEKKQREQEREKLIADLRKALADVKTLSGLLPICSSCKKIRDDKGYWNQIEQYIKDHSDADFSHSLCPECARKLYPELYKNK